MSAELFLVEIRTADWPRSVTWYRSALGLETSMDDPAHRFALFSAGPGRIALKGGGASAPGREAVRLTFLVPDVDAERARLTAAGVAVGEPIDNPAEGYREVRLHDPDGTPISLFAWTGPPPT